MERPGAGTKFRWKTDELAWSFCRTLLLGNEVSKEVFFALLCSLCTHNATTAVLHKANAKTERKVIDDLFTFTARTDWNLSDQQTLLYTICCIFITAEKDICFITRKVKH